MRQGSRASEYGVPGKLWLLFALLMAVGIACMIVGFAVVSAIDTWLWMVVYFLIFGGLAQGIILWAAVFRVSQARWTPAINRLGHAGVAFLPISFAVLIVLVSGVKAYIPWATVLIPEKAAWLNIPFFVIRELLAVFILGVLDFLLVRWTLSTDARTARGNRVTDEEQHRLTALGVAIVMVHVMVFSIIAYDFIMSLSPKWVSTMFPAYYWVTNSYAALGVLVIIAWLLRKPLGVEDYITHSEFNDLGNLMLGFSLFSMGLFFAQYLTIWYGNMPNETDFLILRYFKGPRPWPWLGWISFFLGYAIPFLLLQSRSLKHSPKWLSVVAFITILGIMLERYVLVVPSIKPWALGLSVVPGLMGFGFLGAFIIAIALFLSRYPSVSTAEEALRDIEPELEAITHD